MKRNYSKVVFEYEKQKEDNQLSIDFSNMPNALCKL